MRKLANCDHETGERRYADHTVTYYDYEQNADLSYAVTGHSAQGRTVRQAHALITGTETREWAYMALTRATDGNYAHVMTASPACAHCGEALGQLEEGQWSADGTPAGIRCEAAPGRQHSRTLHHREADPQPGTRPAPELARHEMIQQERSGRTPLPDKDPAGSGAPDREPIGVLSDVLEREGAGG
jgi:hypothetical protein